MVYFPKLKGFSLVELSVVLAILGIVFYAASSSFGEFYFSSKVEQSKSKVVDIKKQLMNYAVVNKFLPCPDTDFPPDGNEDRSLVVTASGTFQRCDSDVGSVPYADIGMELEDVQDPFGNLIRYAVNRNADNNGATGPAVICDKTQAASFFCNEGDGRFAWFTLTDTPPTALSPANIPGNYFICNENVSSCSGTPPNPEDLVMDSVVAILVAYNEDGAKTLANCGAASGATAENCDINDYYHQAAPSVQDSDFFDDVIVGISGYELKRDILSNLTFSTKSADNIAKSATFEGYDLTAADNYTPLNSPQNPDVIRVNRDVQTSLDLGLGDDEISIGNDLKSELVYDNRYQDTFATVAGVLQDGSQANLDTGNGDDKVYIGGDAYSDIDLGRGNNKLVLGGELKKSLLSGNGDDEVWIQGGLESSADIDLDRGDDVLWIGVYGDNTSGLINSSSGSIDGGADDDVIVFENLTKADWLSDSDLQNKFTNFEYVIFKDDGTGNREVLEL